MRAFLVLALLAVVCTTLQAKSVAVVAKANSPKETLPEDEHNKRAETDKVSGETTTTAKPSSTEKSQDSSNIPTMPTGLFPIEFDVGKVFANDDKNHKKDLDFHNILQNIVNLPKHILKKVCEFVSFMDREESKGSQDHDWYRREVDPNSRRVWSEIQAPKDRQFPPGNPHGYPHGYPPYPRGNPHSYPPFPRGKPRAYPPLPHGYPPYPHDYPGHGYPPRYPHDYPDRDYDHYPGHYPEETPRYPQEGNRRAYPPRGDEVPRQNGAGKGLEKGRKPEDDGKIFFPRDDERIFFPGDDFIDHRGNTISRDIGAVKVNGKRWTKWNNESGKPRPPVAGKIPARSIPMDGKNPFVKDEDHTEKLN